MGCQTNRLYSTTSEDLFTAAELIRKAWGFRSVSEFVSALVRDQLLHSHDLTLVSEMATLDGYERDTLDKQILQTTRERLEAQRASRLTFDEVGILISKAKPEATPGRPKPSKRNENRTHHRLGHHPAG